MLRVSYSPEHLAPAQSSSTEADHKGKQHRSDNSSREVPTWNPTLPLRHRPDISPGPPSTTAAGLITLAGLLAHVELVQPQCISISVLQEAVVQATVDTANVGENQVPLVLHVHWLQFTV